MTHHSGSWGKQTGHEVRGGGRIGPRMSDLTLAHSSAFSLAVCHSLPPRSWKIWMMRTSGSALWMKRKTLLLPRNWVSVAAGDLSSGPMSPSRQTPAEFSEG